MHFKAKCYIHGPFGTLHRRFLTSEAIGSSKAPPKLGSASLAAWAVHGTRWVGSWCSWGSAPHPRPLRFCHKLHEAVPLEPEIPKKYPRKRWEKSLLVHLNLFGTVDCFGGWSWILLFLGEDHWIVIPMQVTKWRNIIWKPMKAVVQSGPHFKKNVLKYLEIYISSRLVTGW